METGKAELETMVSVIQKLEQNGFTAQFKATEKGLISMSTENVFQPSEVKIVNFYRFEGESDPEDNSIVYAVETNNGEKGTLIDGYSNSSSPEVSIFIRQVNDIHKQAETTERR